MTKMKRFCHMAEWTLKLSQQLLKVSTICQNTCFSKSTEFINCSVNDAVVHDMPNNAKI